MRNTILLFLCFFVFTNVFSQSEYTIASVKFEGLKRNKEDYLRLFVQSKVDQFLDQEKIDDDLDLLNRRTGIAKSTINIDTLANQQVDLTYVIEEQRTLIPQFGIGGIRNNFWWQVGFAEFNLGGRGQTIQATYLHNDGRPNGKVFYQNDWFKGTPWGYGGDLNHSASVEPLFFPGETVFYRYSNTGAGVFGSYNFGFNNKLLIGTNFFQENYEKEDINPLEPTPGPDQLTLDKLLIKANLDGNNLGYDYFYLTCLLYTSDAADE